MPGTNQFLPFAVGAGANTLTPTAYAALTTLLAGGFQAGVAPSAQFNTALRQATTAAAGLAQFIANQGFNANDDGSAANFAAALSSAMGVAAAGCTSAASLVISATGANANVSITAAEVVLRGADGSSRLASNLTLTVNTAVTGANGLDAGTLSASTWYSVWIVSNGTTAASLVSLSSTSPTMPSGYTHKARVGWIRTDGSGNKFPLSFKQCGRQARYVVGGSNLGAFPQMASGISGNINTPSFTPVAVGTFVPPTASEIALLCSYHGGGSATALIVAPNASYGATTSTSNPAPLQIGISTPSDVNIMGGLLLESSNIYWASAQSGNGLFCMGWEDNL